MTREMMLQCNEVFQFYKKALKTIREMALKNNLQCEESRDVAFADMSVSRGGQTMMILAHGDTATMFIHVFNKISETMRKQGKLLSTMNEQWDDTKQEDQSEDRKN